jgi:hypothetical protein
MAMALAMVSAVAIAILFLFEHGVFVRKKLMFVSAESIAYWRTESPSSLNRRCGPSFKKSLKSKLFHIHAANLICIIY